jgi:phage shock protein C
MKDIDRRLADIESYVTTENRSLAREIEALAGDKGGNG